MDLTAKDLFLTEMGLAFAYLLAIGAIAVGLVPMTPLRSKVAKACFWGACVIFAGVAIAWGSLSDAPTFARTFVVAACCIIAAVGALATAKFFRRANLPELPSITKGPNDGGDSHGPGGAGGGGLGGRGGVAYGTGGGGGGGSALGGGGGGGGENAPGGAGGIGGGGGGGGKGAPGGPGGPGAIIIKWTGEKPAAPPATLYQAFQNDAYAGGYVGRGDLVLAGPNGILTIEINLAWGKNCGSTSLWIHIPETEKLFEVLEIALADYRIFLGRLDMQRKLPAQSGCNIAPTTSPEARFSGNIYVYSEGEIGVAHQEELRTSYAKDCVCLEFRGKAYLVNEQKNRPAEADKSEHSVVMMMVGDDAPPASGRSARRSAAAYMARAG